LWGNEKTNKLKFREDLFHRFNEFSITVPPLRERKADIRIFAAHFLAVTNADLGRTIRGFTPEVLHIFDTYVWYGNLRELKNVVKRAALLTDDDWIDVRSLPFEISNFHKLQFDRRDETVIENSAAPVTEQMESLAVPATQTLKSAGMDAEYEMILEAMKKVNFNKTKAAKLLNIDRKTLYNKLEHYQLLK
jgi:two-component system response regulator HydG